METTTSSPMGLSRGILGKIGMLSYCCLCSQHLARTGDMGYNLAIA